MGQDHLEIEMSFCGYCAFIFGELARKWTRSTVRPTLSRFISKGNNLGRKVGFGIVVFANAETKKRDHDVPKLNIQTDPESLTPSYLLKQSTTDTVISVLRILNLTTTAILEAESEYQKALGTLISLTEYSMEVLGNEYTQDLVEQQVIAARSAVESCKKSADDLGLFMLSVTSLVEAAAEAAFRVDAEYASVLASNNLFSASQQIKLCRQKSRDLEMQQLQLTKKVISVTSKHAEQLNKEMKEN